MLENVGSKTRRLLAGSLGGLVLLTVATGVTSLVVLERFGSGQAVLRARFVERSRALERVRNAILLSGTLARDYFLAPDEPGAPLLLQRIRNLETQTGHDLDSYPQPSGLRGEVTTYWKLLDLMTDLARSRRTAGLDEYFRRQLEQRRETMLQISGSIGSELDREWRAGETSFEIMRDRFRRVLAVEIALVAVLGLAVSWGTVRKVTGLESQTRALSAQLVRAQEEERTAIARELHDEIGQALSGLLLDVGSAARLESSPEVRTRLENISASAENTVESVRRIALSLRPSMLDDLGLVAALEWQAREVGQRSGLDVQVEAEDRAGDIPGVHSTCIYRIAQEALQNCARHSGAKRVRVGLTRSERAVRLEVKDDGRGFAAHRVRGMGLLGMEERAAQVGGRFRVQSEPGRGTTVMAELPV